VARKEGSNDQYVEMWKRIDTDTGKLTDLLRRPESYPYEPNIDLRVVETRSGLGESGADPQIPVLWLQSNVASKSRAMVAPGATRGSIAPDGSAVSYISQGALWISRIERMRRADFDAAYDRAIQDRAVLSAKQVGLATTMYANDYDEMYPPADDFENLVYPYIKNRDVLQGFVFLMNGDSLSGIKSPATTIIGYIIAPGGRAVVYADGHVKWIPADHASAPAMPRRRTARSGVRESLRASRSANATTQVTLKIPTNRRV
jgi:prepilin-type processing-associated H-X9-DG protein